MKQVSNAIIVASLIVSSSAFAGQHHIPTFADMKRACKSPGQYQNQNAPKDMKLSCEEKRTTWFPEDSNSRQLDNLGSITSSLNSDKYYTSPEKVEIQVPPMTVGCPIWNQVEIVVKTDQDVGCEQIDKYETADALCKDILESIKKGMDQDGAIQQVRGKTDQTVEYQGMNIRYTGATFSTCKPEVPVQQPSQFVPIAREQVHMSSGVQDAPKAKRHGVFGR